MSTVITHAGKWTVEIADPHPCWITLRHKDEGTCFRLIHHEDLADLEYAVKRARYHARHKLTPMARRHDEDEA